MASNQSDLGMSPLSYFLTSCIVMSFCDEVHVKTTDLFQPTHFIPYPDLTGSCGLYGTVCLSVGP